MAGFALETDHELDHAADKLKRKNLDFIVLNSLRDAGAGFGHDTNKVDIIGRDGTRHPFPLKTKTEVAQDIIEYLCEIIRRKQMELSERVGERLHPRENAPEGNTDVADITDGAGDVNCNVP